MRPPSTWCAGKSRGRIAAYVIAAVLSVIAIVLLIVLLGGKHSTSTNSSSNTYNAVIVSNKPAASLMSNVGSSSSSNANLTAFESSSNAFVINFLTQQAYGHNLTVMQLNQALVFNRSGAADALNLAGALIGFAANVPRITDQGLIMESATTLLLQNAFNPQNWTSCRGAPSTKLAVDRGFYPLQYSSPTGGGDCSPPSFPVVSGQPFIFRIRYSAPAAIYNKNSSLSGSLRLDLSISGGRNTAAYGYTGNMGTSTIFGKDVGQFDDNYRTNTYIGNGVWEYEHLYHPNATGSCSLHFYAGTYPSNAPPVIMYGIQVESGTNLSSWSSHNIRSTESASYTAQVQTVINSPTTNHIYAMDYTGLVTELTKSSSLPVPFKRIVKIGVFSFALSDSQKLMWAYQKKILRGINLSGAEFDSGTYWPSNTLVDYYAMKNADHVRLPFRWERAQPTLGGALDLTYVQEMDRIVNRATNVHNMTIQLDMHNFDRINGVIIGEPGGATASNFADVWSKIASRYINNTLVVIGLMNEPYGVDTSILITVQSTAASAIRAVGFKGLILYSASGYTGATQFGSPGPQDTYSPLNYVQNVGPVAMDIHCYLDPDGSGTNSTCVPGAGGATRLGAVTQWARKNKITLYLGEFAGGYNAQCAIEVANHISYMESNRDVWKGWTVWGGGFPASYIYAIDPNNGVDRPMISFYTPSFNKTF